MSHAAELPQQTPAQWAVRWHGLVLGAVLLAAVPVCHVVWHVLLGHAEPPIVTKSQTAAPVATAATLLDGTYAHDLEIHLREASPLVWRWRGEWNEALYRMGLGGSRNVAVGSDGWHFLRATLAPDQERFARDRGERNRVFAAVRDLVRKAGAELVVSVVPDKASVYPQFAFADPSHVERKDALRAQLHRELVALGIAAPDVTAALRVAAAAAAAAGEEPIYYRRDTHWRPQGALAGATAVAAAIEALPVAAALPPRWPAQLGARSSVDAIGDLVSQLGMLAVERVDPNGKLRALPMSLLTGALVERRDYYSVVLGGAPPMDAETTAPDAGVLVIGTSFANENGARALALALGRPVRSVIAFGASGQGALEKALPELREGTRAKVVVWEIVERGLLEANWGSIRP